MNNLNLIKDILGIAELDAIEKQGNQIVLRVYKYADQANQKIYGLNNQLNKLEEQISFLSTEINDIYESRQTGVLIHKPGDLEYKRIPDVLNIEVAKITNITKVPIDDYGDRTKLRIVNELAQGIVRRMFEMEDVFWLRGYQNSDARTWTIIAEANVLRNGGTKEIEKLIPSFKNQ